MNKTQQEFNKNHKELLLSLTKITAILPEEIKDCKNLEDGLIKAENDYNILIENLNELKESENLYELEKIRLEFTRISAKLAKFREKENSYSSESSSWLFELTSLSFFQIIKIGFAFSLPLMIAVILGSIIVALVYLEAIGV